MKGWGLVQARGPGLLAPPPNIIGIDEVGVGCWAGPVAVCGVLAPNNFFIEGLTDSKALSKKKHTKYDLLVREQALGICLVAASHEDIDEVGIHQVVRDCMRRVIAELRPFAGSHLVIIDGDMRFEGCVCLPKADKHIQHVSAASVVAKRARDLCMQQYAADKFKGYGFEKHVGYGTKAHRDAIKKLGVCSIHRRSYRPIREALKLTSFVRVQGPAQWMGPSSAMVIFKKEPP